MNRALYKIVLSALFTLLVNASFSQTLYWVDGSGNFNDPKHWSLSSGGTSSGIVPNSNTHVIFNDLSDVNAITVSFAQDADIRSISIETYQRINFIRITPELKLIIHDSFLNIQDNRSFSCELDFKFSRDNSPEPGLISFGNTDLRSNISIESGNWRLTKLKQRAKNAIFVDRSSLSFDHEAFYLGTILVSDNSSIKFDRTILNVATSINVNPLTQFVSTGAHINKQPVNANHFSYFNFTNKVIFDPNQINIPPCFPTPTLIKPSCIPGCDGTVIVTIPQPSCYLPGPVPSGLYSLEVAADATCTAFSGLTGVGPGTYTLTNVCFCNTDYALILYDQATSTFLENQNVSVIPPNITKITINTKTITCNGACTGSLNMAVVGGVAPYTFTVSPPSAASYTASSPGGGLQITNICAGILTVQAKDSKNCTPSAPFTFTFTQPPPILPNAITNSVLCFNACNGTISANPTGGTPGYTVSFGAPISTTYTVPAAGTASVGGLCPGAYSGTITDTKGCTVTTNYTITQPTSITVVPTQTNLLCNAVCNGQASVSVSGGVSPYFYVWSPSASGTNVASGLCSGTQTVSILDNNACPRTQTFNITSPPAITITLTGKNVTCNSLCNGSATVNASGGVAPFTFTWTGPAPFTTSNASVITNICPGVYTLTSLDANLCSTIKTVNITQPPAATVTANVTNNTCFSSCAGSATVTIAGGNGAPFGYTWTPGVTIPQGQGTATLNSLCQGSYTLSAKDASACPIGTVITITQPSSITPNITTQTVNCNGACTGSINAAPVGGSGGPYTFTLFTPIPSSIVGLPPYTNLCAGIYTLAIKDVSNCVSSTTINISQPNPLVPSIVAASVTCFNACNGSLAGSVIGGTPGYTLNWATPTGTVAGGNLINQCAGNYTFFVTDAKSCTAQTTFTLLQPADITATFNVTNPTCNTSCNGQISSILAGGTPGYTLNWSNSGGNPNINLCAGVYTLTVNDSKNCIKIFTAGVVAPPAFTIAIVTKSTVCAGDCNGSATVTATGGTGLITYQFNTVPVTTNTTGIVSGLCAGVYIVNVTDANGCATPTVFNINPPPLLTAAITGIKNTCNICTGGATVTVNGGVPGYTVNWTNTLSASVGTGTTVAGLCLGTYTANVVDANGCTKTATVSIANTVTVTVVTSGSSILCFGACNASATANPSGGTAPYTFTWNSAPTQTTQTALGLCAGAYTVTVVDFIGCSNTGSITFTQPSSITVTSSQTNIPCFGGCIGAITTTASGGTGPYTYSWSPSGQTTSSLTSLCTGTYSIKITDLHNCTLTPATFTIASNPSLTVVFTSTSPTGCNLSNGVISATASGGSGAGYTFTWTPPSVSVVAGPVTTASSLGAGTYTLLVKDGAGCTNSFVTSLSNPAGPTVNVTSTSLTCFGGANGSATAIATGAGPFTFTWNPATASVVAGATTTASGMITGTYNISVTDINTGCITSQSISLLQPTQMTITSNVTNASCNASNNGSITATVAGGTPNYTLNWLPAGTGTAITNLGPGNYTVNVNDANGCALTKTFVITAPSSLTVASSQTNVSCNSGTNGAVSLTVTGGTAAYTFTWTPIGPFPGSAASSVNGLPPNVYTVTIADANGCSTIRNFTITQPTPIVHSLITSNAVCNSLCNGTASQVVSGGTPTYSFSWSSSAATTQSLGALCAGNYTANVVDGNGCVSSKTFVITQPSVIAITVTPTNPKCNAQCNGSITTNVTGGNPGYVYSWLPAGAGPNPTGLCAGNYTLTITDASLCPGSAVVTLTNPPLIVANITFSSPACNAFCNGSATATPVNAIAPVQYTWTNVPASFTNMASGLCAGTYSVFILDNNGCTDTASVTLSNPPVLNVNVSILAATCNSANASVSVTPSGGTPTYTFAWTPAVAGNTNVAVNIFAGIYTVSVTDANGCNNTISVPVGNANGASNATIAVTNVNCNSQCTGGATVTAATGGTTPYIFSWVAPPSASTVNPQSNLCAGIYTAQVKDNNGCLYFQSINITEPPPIDDNETVSNAFCIGVCNGSVVLAPAGGTGTFSYVWSPPTSTTNIATGLCVGVHTATITDQAGCTFTASYNVNGTTVLTNAIASSSNPCFGNCVASSTVTATGGGLAPYTYAWSNMQTGIIANNLCNGTYSVVVTDNNGCQNTFTTGITSPAAITIAPSISSPSCGMCNGSATVTTAGGTTPFTYSWTSSSTTSVEANLCAGLYQVMVTDFNGCTQTQNIPISNSSSITETHNVQDELCFNSCNGSATVTPTGGTPPFAFNWINPVSSNSIVTNLCGGTYFFQIIDGQGCILTNSVAVNSATNININPSIQPPTCGSITNGTITVNPTGGSGTYTISWLPVGSGSVITGGAGVYTVSVFDGTCTQTMAINVSNSTAPVLFFTQHNNGCAGGPCTGSVVVTPTLGTPQYNFNWSNGQTANSVASDAVTGLCAGVITLTVSDAAGCIATQSFTITQNPALNLSLPFVSQIKCNGDCNGSIQLIPSGGALPYVISWIPATTVTPTNPLTNLCAGSYTGIVTDVNGCVLTKTIDILNPLPYTFSAQVTDATCNSSNDGAITTTVSGATPGYTYTWTDASSNTFTTTSLTNVLPGTYSLSIIDSQGCPKDTMLTVAGSFTVVANASPDMTLCMSPSLITLDGSASINGQTYNWTQLSPTVNIANTVSTSVLPAVGSNSYVLLVTSSVAICFDTEMVVININPLPDVNAGPTQSISLYTQANLGGSPTSISGTSFTWFPATDLNNPNIANPVTSTTVNTEYTVFVTDANGCVSSSTVDVFIFPDVKIPNGFSPNADGRNDSWIIDNIQQFTECTVEVYNRWGELLFQSPPGYPKPWDGRYHNKELPVGTYYYIINLNHVAYPKPYTGPITIFR